MEIRLTTWTEQSMCGLAADVRLAGELLESHGLRALHATNSWTQGPRSANLQPHGGWRHEEITHVDGTKEIVPIPSDTVGEAILDDDKAGEKHAELVAILDVLPDTMDRLIRLLRSACPTPQVLKAEELTDAQWSSRGWCVSCRRDGDYCEPVAIRPNGKRRYKDYCNWCGEFAAANKGKRPPVKLVKMRREGRRITQRDVDAAMADERKPTPKKKKGKKAA